MYFDLFIYFIFSHLHTEQLQLQVNTIYYYFINFIIKVILSFSYMDCQSNSSFSSSWSQLQTVLVVKWLGTLFGHGSLKPSCLIPTIWKLKIK